MRRSRLAATAAASVLALLFSLVVTTPAAAATFTVSGTITGLPAPGADPEIVREASVWLFYPGTYDSPGWADTDSNGQFVISNVPAGDYELRVTWSNWRNPADLLGWAEQWYGDTPLRADSDILSVAADTEVNMTLVPGGSISGVIKGNGFALPDGFVWAYLVNPADGGRQLAAGDQADAQGNYVLDLLPAGNYVLEFFDRRAQPVFATEYWQNKVKPADATLVSLTSGEIKQGYDADLVTWTIDLRRLAGSDRFATSALIAADTFEPGVDVVFLASGMNYPDALAAGPVAAKLGGPVLLTAPDQLPAAVAQEIERLNPERVVIVGGPTTVSPAVMSAVAELGFDVDRISGSDRFETSREIASLAFDSSEYVFIATGLGFPDALSAGAAAALYSAPVILVNGSASSLDAATTNLLRELAPDGIYVVGGQPSVSAGIENDLRELSESYTQRLAGPNRYATSSEVLKYIFLTPKSSLYTAVGTNFPDALAGAAAAGAAGAPLLITPSTCMYTAAREMVTRLRVSELILLGGPTTISSDVRWEYCD